MLTLFDPIQMGALTLPNRIVMAPMTRCRADEDRTPNLLMAKYYTQRATAGLIISEGTSVSPLGVGYPRTPGIWSEKQVEGWKPITDAVHKAGGSIVMQLWHVGRISDPFYLNGQLPVAPSPIAAKGHVSLFQPKKTFVAPRALALNEIPSVIEAYRQGAQNAKKAGFDGVEIHGANGYLPDQFLQTSTNTRTDDYGGSVENRARFLLEATDAVISVWGAGRVGVHLAPRCDANDAGDSDPATTFKYVAKALKERDIAFIFTREYFHSPPLTPILKKAFGGPLIANEQFTLEMAEKTVQQGVADAVAFGLAYIANPDLVARFQTDSTLNALNKTTIYGKGPKGYTDYPCLPTT